MRNLCDPLFFGRPARLSGMQLEEIQRILKSREQELRELGVASLLVFGSVARREESVDSDVDMLVGFDRPTGLFGLIRLRLFLESHLQCKIDLGTVRSLRSEFRDEALAEAVRVA